MKSIAACASQRHVSLNRNAVLGGRAGSIYEQNTVRARSSILLSRPTQAGRGTSHTCLADRSPRESGGFEVPLAKPRFSYLLLGANLAVYSAGIIIALTVGNDASNDFFLTLASVNERVAAGEWWRLISANFLHAGLLHLGLNTVALIILGPEVEAVLGYGTFLSIYLLSGVSGSVASYVLNDLVTVGASSSIFGLLGALAAYFIRNPKLDKSPQQIAYIFSVVGANFLLGFLDEGGLVDNTGHVGGLLAGLGLGLVMSPSYVLVRDESQAVSVPLVSPGQSGAEEGVSSSSNVDSSTSGGGAPSTSQDKQESVSGSSEQQTSAPVDTSVEHPTESLSSIEASLARLDQLSVGPTPEAVPDESQTRSSEETSEKAQPDENVLKKASYRVVDQTSNAARGIATATFVVSLALATWAGTAAYVASHS